MTASDIAAAIASAISRLLPVRPPFFGLSDMLSDRTNPGINLAPKRHAESQISVKCVRRRLVSVSMAAGSVGPHQSSADLTTGRANSPERGTIAASRAVHRDLVGEHRAIVGVVAATGKCLLVQRLRIGRAVMRPLEFDLAALGRADEFYRILLRQLEVDEIGAVEDFQHKLRK